MFIEYSMMFRSDVLEEDLHKIIPITPVLLVIKPDRMTYLVHYYLLLKTTRYSLTDLAGDNLFGQS